MTRSPAASPPYRPTFVALVLLNGLGLAGAYLAATMDVAVFASTIATQGTARSTDAADLSHTGNSARSRPATELAITASLVATPPAPEDRDEVLARPLFRPDRRPWQQAAAVASSASPTLPLAPIELAQPPPDVRLVGLVLTGTKARALIRLGAGTTGQWFARGDLVNGWQLAEIDRDRIVLEAFSQRQEFVLDRRRADAAQTVAKTNRLREIE